MAPTQSRKPRPRKKTTAPTGSPRQAKRARPRRRRASRKSWRWWCGIVCSTVLAVVGGAYAGLYFWAKQPGLGTGRLVAINIPSGTDLEISRHLSQQGLLDSPLMFIAYLRLLKPKLRLEVGEHLLLDSLAPRDLAAQLARLSNRQSVRLTLLEGWTHLEIAQLLEARGICSQASFVDAVRDEALLERLGLEAESAEGYLFPDTYDLRLDSSAESVVVSLVQHAKRNLAELRQQHREAANKLLELFGFSEQQWVTLASMLEKEAANPAELPIIASVFFNRLTDPSFRPERMLQSDPTAAYGCLIEPDRAESCEAFEGKVLPAMLRDASNRYNTYKHAGLPPGPIANPGRAALLAVLKPADTPYLFFFADGKGSHFFTRTFDEHRAAIRGERER